MRAKEIIEANPGYKPTVHLHHPRQTNCLVCGPLPAALDGGQPATETRRCWGCSHGDHARCERTTDVCECDCPPATEETP